MCGAYIAINNLAHLYSYTVKIADSVVFFSLLISRFVCPLIKINGNQVNFKFFARHFLFVYTFVECKYKLFNLQHS